MSVSAYETTDNGGTATETAVLAGDCRQADVLSELGQK
jgi:hypothetical protein